MAKKSLREFALEYNAAPKPVPVSESALEPVPVPVPVPTVEAEQAEQLEPPIKEAKEEETVVNSNNRLRDLPANMYPIERLIQGNSAELAQEDLIAILLQSGLRGKNVLELARDLLCQVGSLDALARMDASQIVGLCKGIGKAKAAKLAAAFELGSRALRESSERVPLNSALVVYDYMIGETRRMNQESVFVLVVNTKNKLLRKYKVATGGLNECVAHPREILRPAIINQAHGFFLVHNHPSGNPTPSNADNILTQRIADAASLMGIAFIDHIIMGYPTGVASPLYYSYANERKIPPPKNKS